MELLTLNDVNPYIINCGYLNEKNCPPAGTRYEMRRVKWYELELILWGEGYIITEGEKLFVTKGDLTFRKPGMVVQGVSPYHCYSIIFDILFDKSRIPLYLESECYNNTYSCDRSYENFVSGNFPDLKLPAKMNVQQLPKYEELFRNTVDAFVRGPANNRFFLKTCVMQILSNAITEWASTGMLRSPTLSIRCNHPRITRVKNHIDDNCIKRLKLGDLAEVAGLSPNFLCKIFKDITGENIIDYVNRCRINKAKKLLLDTNQAVKGIAYECGFENETYFFTLFKKKEGLSPSEYRKKHRLLFRY